MDGVMAGTGKAVLLASLTTMVGFSGLLTTDHLGLVSLGRLALLGIAASLFASFTTLPALFSLRSQSRSTRIH